MRTCLKYARVFWAIAILLMAGGQAIHAYEDFSCSTQHASEHQTSGSDQSTCPVGHTSCLGHSHVVGALSEAPDFALVILTSGFFFDRGNTAVEGPVREIDCPPQLS